MSRLSPLDPPYDEDTQNAFDAIMPPGVPPLVLFRTLARFPRIYKKFRAGSLLDRGPLSLRLREITIDRTCALNGCAYEWGVHVAFFAERARLTPDEIAALAGDGVCNSWSAAERTVIAACDELHATARLSDATWRALAAAFDEAQIMEVIALAGFYRTVSYFCNGLGLPPEPYGAPLRGAASSRTSA
ncbi:MAG: carboxymuconolactone decarboxylase family protein [Hyphomonadaceae bacterium]|nr:carboxymuconolactone decarboxylase family protein [Hyphomonadaceae bacterium]